MKKPLGGFFELTLPEGIPWHHSALRLNSARSALRFYLRKRGIRRIYLPEFICDTLIKALQKDDVDIRFYPLDKSLFPIPPKDVSAASPLLVANYFGMNLSAKVATEHKIVDNSQAFFLPADNKIPTIYSPRKFFGVADGGYLYGCTTGKSELKESYSWEHYQANLMRIEVSPEKGLSVHRQNEERISEEPVAAMSKLTDRLLGSVPYKACKVRRERNFFLLHKRLKPLNTLKLVDPKPDGPMAYPFMARSSGLTEYLREQDIFCATYWPEVLSRCSSVSWAAMLVQKTTPLPIDHRLTDADMARICMAVETFCHSEGKTVFPTTGAENG